MVLWLLVIQCGAYWSPDRLANLMVDLMRLMDFRVFFNKYYEQID